MDRSLSHGSEKRDRIAPASHTVGWQRDYCAGPRARLTSIKKAGIAKTNRQDWRDDFPRARAAGSMRRQRQLTTLRE
jgi:hypothetical protein